MHIGIDGLPLLTPLTGVGHYTLELARALSSLAPTDEFQLLAPGVPSRAVAEKLNTWADQFGPLYQPGETDSVPLPDLLIRSAHRVEPGSTKVVIRIANIGKGDAGYFEVSYVCDWYPKEAGKPSFLAGAVIAVEGLAAGESKPFEVDCQKHVPTATKLKFGASVDWNKKVKEANEKNNTYSDPNLK